MDERVPTENETVLYHEVKGSVTKTVFSGGPRRCSPSTAVVSGSGSQVLSVPTGSTRCKDNVCPNLFMFL